jgi:hypothetical protein
VGISSTLAYRKNRARFPLAELQKFDGQWVAFSADGGHIVASASTIVDLANRARALKVNLQDLVVERIEMEGLEINLGGAELR